MADAPADLVAVPAEISDEVSRRQLSIRDLPPDWRAYPAPERLADLGTEWVRSAQTALLIVPSVIIPQESNYLINPAHRDTTGIRVGRPEAFSVDPRLRKR